MALTVFTGQLAEGEAQRAGDQEDGQHLHEVGQHGWVLERVRRVGAEEAAAVGAEHLDRFLRGHWPHRQRLLRTFERGDVQVRQEVLQRALADEEQGDQQRDRQQHIQRDAEQIGPGVADGLAGAAGKGADQRKGHGDAGGGGDEVLHRQPGHLAEIAESAFTAVGLPVGVGDEADGGVECQIPGEAREALRVERQRALRHQQGEQQRQAEQVERQDRQRVLPPVHLGGADAAGAPDAGFHPAQRRQRLTFDQARHKAAQRPGQQQKHQQETGDQ